MHAPSALIRKRLFDVRKQLFEVRERLSGALRFPLALKKRPPTLGDFEKKNEITIGRRPFFERTSEAKCPEKPLANLEKPLANDNELAPEQ